MQDGNTQDKGIKTSDFIFGDQKSSENLPINSSATNNSILGSHIQASPVGLAWSSTLISLKKEMDAEVFSAYLSRLQLESYDEVRSELRVSAPSNFICKHIDEKFSVRILEVFNSILSNAVLVKSDIGIRFFVKESSSSGNSQNDTLATSHGKSPYVVVKKIASHNSIKNGSIRNSSQRGGESAAAFGQAPNPRYSFSNFIVGNSNQFCHAAAMRVAENPGESYNPLFIYGGVGLGKTHLMHAIGNAVLQTTPTAKVLYISSEAFTNALIHSLRRAKMDEFKNLMRNIEVLLIDDIQFMRGKETTQEEFFHTFNALYSAKHQIVITSDKNPAEIPGIEERLRTRFAWGLTADLQAPDFETRVAILNEKANRESFLLPEDVAHFISENFASNVRELEGALTRLHAVSSLQKMPINLELAESALRSLLQPKVTNITVDEIKRAVSGYFNIKISDMVSKRRSKNLAFPRHIAMFLCRKHTAYSYPEIGSAFGGRDHSSVIHAANVIAEKVKSSSEMKGVLEEIEKLLLWN